MRIAYFTDTYEPKVPLDAAKRGTSVKVATLETAKVLHIFYITLHLEFTYRC